MTTTFVEVARGSGANFSPDVINQYAPQFPDGTKGRLVMEFRPDAAVITDKLAGYIQQMITGSGGGITARREGNAVVCDFVAKTVKEPEYRGIEGVLAPMQPDPNHPGGYRTGYQPAYWLIPVAAWKAIAAIIAIITILAVGKSIIEAMTSWILYKIGEVADAVGKTVDDVKKKLGLPEGSILPLLLIGGFITAALVVASSSGGSGRGSPVVLIERGR